MNKSRVFMKNGRIVELYKDYGESEEHFIERGNFVVSQNIETSDDHKKAVKLSRLYRNVQFGARYSITLMNCLNEMETNMYEK
jgi:hypothetical protein